MSDKDEVVQFSTLIKDALTTDQGEAMLGSHQNQQHESIQKAFQEHLSAGNSFESCERTIAQSEIEFKEDTFRGLEKFAQKKNGTWFDRQFTIPEGDYKLFENQLKGLTALDKNKNVKTNNTKKHGKGVVVYAVPNSWYSSKSAIIAANAMAVHWRDVSKSKLEQDIKAGRAANKTVLTAAQKIGSPFKAFWTLFDDLEGSDQSDWADSVETALQKRGYCNAP